MLIRYRALFLIYQRLKFRLSFEQLADQFGKGDRQQVQQLYDYNVEKLAQAFHFNDDSQLLSLVETMLAGAQDEVKKTIVPCHHQWKRVGVQDVNLSFMVGIEERRVQKLVLWVCDKCGFYEVLPGFGEPSGI